MKLGEKIAHYRRQRKLSQEELAERVGVSRQSVSKWELGESSPEAGKILTLARELGITADELLSEQPPQEEPQMPPQPPRQAREDRLDHLPGLIGRLVRRYGWLAGAYIAVSGMGVTLVGGFAYLAFRRQLSPILVWQQAGLLDGGVPAGLTTPLLFGKVVLGIGIAMVAAGILLAVVLYRRGRK